MAKDVSIYKTKAFSNLASGLRSKVMTTLGVLVGTSPAYYVASDVAYKIAQNAGATDPDDLKLFCNAVNQVLCAVFSKGQDNVKRTVKKIAPKYATNSKAAFGYRIGMALGVPVVNEDTVRESRTNTECYENLLKQKMPTARLLVDELDFNQLVELQQAIITRMNLLHDKLETVAVLTKHLTQG